MHWVLKRSVQPDAATQSGRRHRSSDVGRGPGDCREGVLLPPFAKDHAEGLGAAEAAAAVPGHVPETVIGFGCRHFHLDWWYEKNGSNVQFELLTRELLISNSLCHANQLIQHEMNDLCMVPLFLLYVSSSLSRAFSSTFLDI